jgi:hypothetical protein
LLSRRKKLLSRRKMWGCTAGQAAGSAQQSDGPAA